MIFWGRRTWRLPELGFICSSTLVGTTSRPPKWIKPQLTRLVDEAPAGDGWLHEIKFDGYRHHRQGTETLGGRPGAAAGKAHAACRAAATRQPLRIAAQAYQGAWVRPEVVVEVTYLTWTEDNLLRQVSYQRQREDKPARQVVRGIPHPQRR
jgi:ATP-dependent DNA ligase